MPSPFLNLTFGDIAILAGFALEGLLAYLVAYLIGGSTVPPLLRRANPHLAAALGQQQFERRLAMLAPPIVWNLTLPLLDTHLGGKEGLLARLVDLYAVIAIARLINALLRGFEQAVEPEQRALGVVPLRRLFQVLRACNVALTVVLCLGVFYNLQLTWLLGSVGVIAAAGSIVFGDLIYNMVARTILVSQRLIAVGDWVEIPDLRIDGEVRAIGPFVVEVQSWDNALVTVPPRYLLSNGFRNWQQMYRSEARRMMRTLFLDLGTVRLADATTLASARELPAVAEHLEGRDGVVPPTNVALYRAALMGYLRAHPLVCAERTVRVTNLDATAQGLPVVLVAYASVTADMPYRMLDAEIYEHAIVTAAAFGLRVFQSPSGADLRPAPEPPAEAWPRSSFSDDVPSGQAATIHDN